MKIDRYAQIIQLLEHVASFMSKIYNDKGHTKGSSLDHFTTYYDDRPLIIVNAALPAGLSGGLDSSRWPSC